MLEIDDTKFIDLIRQGKPIEELERILKPNNLSEYGFLGENEELLELVHDDWKIVESYGTTHHEISTALSQAIEGEYVLNQDYNMIIIEQSLGFQECPWGCMDETGVNIWYISRKDLNQEEVIEGIMSVLEGNTYEPTMTKGLTIITGLHPHLISEHYFFEGKDTFYRSDPTILIPALNLSNLT